MKKIQEYESPIMVTRSSMPPYEEYIEMIKPLWDTAWLTNMGEYHQKFESKLCDYLQVENISLMTNGHMSLELAIQAMHLQGEVITTPFTFVSTIHAIVRNRLTPVFCDIDPETYTIDAKKIEELITEKTCAILPVHVYGCICDVEAIEQVAKKHNLKVIYDAAHTFGETYKGKSVVSYGDVSILSFHATKVFNTIEGGAVVYHDDAYGKELYGLKNFGIQSETIVDGIGANAKLDEFRAAMGICNLNYINQEIEKRKKCVEHYRKRLQGIDNLMILKEQKNVVSNYAYFPIIIRDVKAKGIRDNIYDKLKEHGIYSRKYFYPLITEMECYKERYSSKDTPIAKRISESVLTIPLYANLQEAEIDRICDIIRKIL